MTKSIKFLSKNKYIMLLFLIDLIFYIFLFFGFWLFSYLGEKLNWDTEKASFFFLLAFIPIMLMKLYKEISKSKNKREIIYGKKD